MKRKKNITLPRSILQVLLILWAIGQIFPLIWLFYSSFKPSNDIMMNVWSLPKSFYTENYSGIWIGSEEWGGVTVTNLFKNSMIVSACSLLLLTFLPAFAAYSIAKLKFPGRNFFLILLISMFAIPVHAIILPLYYFFQSMGLINNYLGLIIAYVTLNIPFSVILLSSYFREFPDELLEAARIDGCNEARMFFNVVFPISKGAISTVLIVALINTWNELLLSMVVMSDMSLKTIPAGLIVYQGQYRSEWGYLFAAMLSASVPIIILYFIFQRNIIKGMTLGAVKG